MTDHNRKMFALKKVSISAVLVLFGFTSLVYGQTMSQSSAGSSDCAFGPSHGEGKQKYNYQTHDLELCDGTSWVSLTKASSPSGSLCGYVSPLGGSPQLCDGLNPFKECPTGYKKIALTGPADGAAGGYTNDGETVVIPDIQITASIGWSCVKL